MDRTSERSRPATHLALALALALAGGASAAAQEGAEAESRALARSARAAVRNGNPGEAIQLLQRAWDAFPDPALLLESARIMEKTGDFVEAEGYCRRYLQADTSPAGQRLGRERLEAVLDRIPGRLMLVVEPPDSAVTVDGKASSAGSLSLKRGRHRIVTRAPSFLPDTRTVEVAPGAEVTVTVALQPMPGCLVVACDCAGGRVEVDGRFAGAVPLATPLCLAPGPHFVRVVDADGREYSRRIAFDPGTTVTLVATLAQAARAPAPLSVPVPDVTEEAARAAEAAPLAPLDASPAPRPWYRTWWVWTAIGGAVTAVVVGTAVGVTRAPRSGTAFQGQLSW
jgi:hypothetical protein